jgi:hypothetical protein
VVHYYRHLFSYTQNLSSFDEDRVGELEQKLRSEQTRRHHLQTRLLAEESAHKKEMEEMDRRLAALQKRVDKAELEKSKLALEHSHS